MPMPDSYNPEMFEEILDKIRDTGWIRPILECDEGRAAGYPSYRTWRENWLMRDDNGTKFDEARQDYADKLGFEIIGHADDRVHHPAHNSNSMKSRMWVAERLNRKVWGNRVDVNHGGQKDNPLTQLIQQVSGTSLGPVADTEEEGNE